MIDANRVGADGLHERRVEPALCRVDERVIGDELVRNACYNMSVALSVIELFAIGLGKRMWD
jgi:hypothetical protein